MSQPTKNIGHLETKDGQQVTVTKKFECGTILETKSAQIGDQYEATCYEWRMDQGVHLAFSFKREKKYYIPEVKKGHLVLGEYDDEKILDGDEYTAHRFRWIIADQGAWCYLESVNEPGMSLSVDKSKVILCDITKRPSEYRFKQ